MDHIIVCFYTIQGHSKPYYYGENLFLQLCKNLQGIRFLSETPQIKIIDAFGKIIGTYNNDEIGRLEVENRVYYTKHIDDCTDDEYRAMLNKPYFSERLQDYLILHKIYEKFVHVIGIHEYFRILYAYEKKLSSEEKEGYTA